MEEREYVRPSGQVRFDASPDRETDRFYRGILERLTERIVGDLGGEELLSLILSGSLAMGEGSAYPRPEGGLHPGSDIDLYLVTPEGNVGELGARMQGLRERLLSSLGVSGLVVDLGVTSPERLARLHPSVANCLLAHHGRTLAGDPEVLRQAARPRYEEIPPRDGFVLLLNRTVEELAEFRTRIPEGAGEREYWYRFGKTVRDLGTSALVADRSFFPTLRERSDAVPSFLKREGLEERLPGLAEDHTFWCAQKAHPDLEAARERYGGVAAFRGAQERKRTYIGALWAWETERVFGARPGARASDSLRRADRARRRIAEWARFAGREGPAGTAEAFRRLPRALSPAPLLSAYAAAYLLVLASGPLAGEEESERDRDLLEQAFRTAPLRPRGGGAFRERWVALRESVCGYWNREVMGGSRPPVPVEAA